MKVRNTVCRILRTTLVTGEQSQVYTYLTPTIHIAFKVRKAKPRFIKGQHINSYRVLRYDVLNTGLSSSVSVGRTFTDRSAFLNYLQKTIASEERVHERV